MDCFYDDRMLIESAHVLIRSHSSSCSFHDHGHAVLKDVHLFYLQEHILVHSSAANLLQHFAWTVICFGLPANTLSAL